MNNTPSICKSQEYCPNARITKKQKQQETFSIPNITEEDKRHFNAICNVVNLRCLNSLERRRVQDEIDEINKLAQR